MRDLAALENKPEAPSALQDPLCHLEYITGLPTCKRGHMLLPLPLRAKRCETVEVHGAMQERGHSSAGGHPEAEDRREHQTGGQ